MSQENWVDKFTRWFFWAGYAVFLGASIPHIATYFHHFDAPATGPQETMNWCIAVLLAIVIDVSDVLVSIAVIKAQAAGAKFWDTFGYWAFIVLIMALSWLFNWEYNIVFGTQEFAAADSKSLFGWITIGQLNPVVGSAFQLLLLVYTGMAHKFANKPHEKTAAELEQEARELESKQDALARIEAVKKARRQRGINNIFDDAKAFKDGVIQTVSGVDDLDKTVEFLSQNPQATDEQLAIYLGKKRPASARFWRLKAMEIIGKTSLNGQAKTQPITPEAQGKPIGQKQGNEPISSGSKPHDPITDEVPVVAPSQSTNQGQYKTEASPTSSEGINESIDEEGEGGLSESINDGREASNLASLDYAPETLEVLKRYPSVYSSWLSRGVKSVTIDEVVRVTKQPKRRVQYQAGKALKRTPKNAQKFLIGSVIEWLKEAPMPEQMAEHTMDQQSEYSGDKEAEASESQSASH